MQNIPPWPLPTDYCQAVNGWTVTVRNGRYVIPVRREALSAVGGIVHDASQTGGTLFVEPPAAVEAGNRIRELQTAGLVERRYLPPPAARHLYALGPQAAGLKPVLDALANWRRDERTMPGKLAQKQSPCAPSGLPFCDIQQERRRMTPRPASFNAAPRPGALGDGTRTAWYPSIV